MIIKRDSTVTIKTNNYNEMKIQLVSATDFIKIKILKIILLN